MNAKRWLGVTALAVGIATVGAGAAGADDDAMSELRDIGPARLLQMLTAQAKPSDAAPKTVDEVLALTGHTAEQAQRLVALEQDAAREPIRIDWLDAGSVESARRERALQLEAAMERLAPALERARHGSLSRAVKAVEQAYRAGLRDATEEMVEARGDLSRADRPKAGVEVAAACVGSTLRITVRRNGYEGRFAVAVAPGTVAKPDDQDDRFGSAQDLTLLEAPVIVVPAADDERTIDVSIACASYGWAGPGYEQRYILTAAKPGSPLDALAQHVCTSRAAGRSLPSGLAKPAETQLAVWIAATDIATARWSDTYAFGGQKIGPEHAEGAARLMIESGIDARATALIEGPADAAP